MSSASSSTVEPGIVLALHTDANGLIVQSNKAFAQSEGMPEQSLAGKSAFDFSHADVPAAVHTDIRKALSQQKTWMGTLNLNLKQAGSIWVMLTVTPPVGANKNGQYLWAYAEASGSEITQAQQNFARMRAGKSASNGGLFGKFKSAMGHVPIGKKIGVAVTALSIAISALLISGEFMTVKALIEEEEQLELNQLANVVDTSIQNDGFRAASLASLVAEMPEAKAAFAAGDREKLLDMFSNSFARLKQDFAIKHFQFHAPPAVSFLRLHKPEKFGDDLSGFRHTIVDANNNKAVVSGLEEGKAGYGIRGVVPITQYGQHLGSVEFGIAFGQDFFETFKQEHQVESGFFSLENGTVTSTSATFELGNELSKEDIEAVVAGKTVKKFIMVNGIQHGALARTINDFSGKPVGMIVVAQDHTPYLNHLSDITNRVLVIGLFAVLMSILLSYFLARGLSKPIKAASRIADNLSNGNYNNTIDVRSTDENGTLLTAMAAMQSRMKYNLHEDGERNEEVARIKTALDYISTNVTVSDTNGKLIFMNKACLELFSNLSRIRGQHFDPCSLMGTSLVDFFADDKLKQIFSTRLRDRQEVKYGIWDHEFSLILNPVYDENGNYQARVTQWNDITQEVTVEKEINSIVKAANAGQLSERIGMDGKEGFFHDLATGINEMIEGVDTVISDIATAMNQIANGDLTQPITKTYSGTYDQVKQSVNQTISGLETMVGELRDVSMDISSSSNQISGSNDELSSRTKMQASNLETTAASMEEITGTVNHNAENAQEASILALEAKTVSEQGVGVVREAIGAMGDINAASGKIEEITSVIDELAFQTNLLALNAAVEAARAGDQGRGFAVVANEVRHLAGRSSDAAKQIKALITDSVERVGNGTGLVNSAGEKLDEISGSINRVNSIINEIAHANQEQSIGIQQINQAVTRIDETTQQNTSLADETTTVAQSLKQKAQEMDQMISRFQLSSDSGDHYRQAS